MSRSCMMQTYQTRGGGRELCPQKSSVEVLTLSTQKCDLIWKWAFCTCNLFRRGHTGLNLVWIKSGSQDPLPVLVRRPHNNGDRDRSDASTSQGTPRLLGGPRSQGNGMGQPSRRNQACGHLGVGHPESRTERRSFHFVLSPPVCGTLLWQPQEMNT